MLQAPFPYFGGKSMIAHLIWQYIGDVEHYLEPFFGSGAVLLNRPHYNPQKHTETVCDKDGYLCNVWRAIKYAPEEVAKYCDNPVNHIDLASRRKYLIDRMDLVEKMVEDPEWYDARLAGYWIWCSSCWIGSGMLTKPTNLGEIPHLGDKGRGVNKTFLIEQKSHLTDKVSLIGYIPHIIHKGRGVNKVSLITSNTETLSLCDTIHTNILSWFKQLSDRLRLVRVISGNWSRICGGDWQDKTWNTVGVYFDPPYSSPSRDKNLYYKDDLTVAQKVAEWALEKGKRKSYRIVISGYDDEECYQVLLENGWRMDRWKAHGGYANLGRGKNKNNHKEVLYISPYCINVGLF